jgi:lipopolysaccharide/colanic/teichoic acid biosynthesis glycosyltransferase
MTVHLRQPLPAAALDHLVEQSINPASVPSGYRTPMKRYLDLGLVLISALPALLIVSLFAFVVALDGKNPFYAQKRIGRNGRQFTMWKLRSMVPNADKLLAQHLADSPEARAEWDTYQKLSHDPRITRIGAIIRKTSIDELPQLWNVLIGDMSLVGPRPMLPEQQKLYPGTAYYALRPGITGFWQTSVRNEASFSERAAFDTDYLRELSLATDVKTLIKTVRVVLRGTGC